MSSEICELCPHEADPHFLVATNNHDPRKGGVRICHRKGCPCFSTWSVPQLGSEKDDVVIPSMDEMDEIRAAVQS